MNKKINVIGLGHVGLPTAALLATYGYNVLGVDIDPIRVKQLQSGLTSTFEPRLKNLLLSALDSKNLSFSTNVSVADIYIVAVPTLINPEMKPDISQLTSAVKAICHHIKPHALVIIESTCPIGTTQEVAEIFRQITPDIRVAYCPERMLPGNCIDELLNNDRVVGGVDQISTTQAISFYKTFINGNAYPTCARTAEATKLAENTYRDINIAYANELSMIADKFSIDIHKIIQFANKHPRVNILEPGVGVGGQCVSIDPWYLVNSAPEQSKLISTARKVNSKKTDWVVAKIRKSIKLIKAETIACLGLTYKPNVSETKFSPAMQIVNVLRNEITVLAADPYLPETTPIHEAITDADMVIFLVGHQAFRAISPHLLHGKTVLDFANITTDTQKNNNRKSKSKDLVI